MILAGRAVAEIGMLGTPAGVGTDAEIAHHFHIFRMAELYHFRKKVVRQAGLRRNLAALIPGVAIARDGEGLDDVRAERFIPSDVAGGIGVGPKSRPGEAVRTARSPVEVHAERANRFRLNCAAIRRLSGDNAGQ